MTRQNIRPIWLGLCSGAAMIALAGASLLASSENVLRSSFATALTKSESTVNQRIASAAPISGSEDFWLTAMRRDGSGGGPVSKTISVGDQLSMTLAGRHRTLEVSTVSDFEPKTTKISNAAGPTHFVLVTARDSADTTARPIRFIMEVDQGDPSLVMGSRGGRAL